MNLKTNLFLIRCLVPETQDPLCGRVFEAPFQVQAFDDFGLGVQLVPWIAVASIDNGM